MVSCSWYLLLIVFPICPCHLLTNFCSRTILPNRIWFLKTSPRLLPMTLLLHSSSTLSTDPINPLPSDIHLWDIPFHLAIFGLLLLFLTFSFHMVNFELKINFLAFFVFFIQLCIFVLAILMRHSNWSAELSFSQSLVLLLLNIKHTTCCNRTNCWFLGKFLIKLSKISFRNYISARTIR